MYRFHRTLHRGHQGRNGHLHRLALFQFPGVGVAVILLQPHFGVIRQRGYLSSLADLIAGVQRHHIHQLPGIGGGQIQPRNVFLQGVDLLLIALHLVAGLLHLGGGVGRVNGKQGIPLLYVLALLHEHVHHGTGRGQADGLAVLGLHQTAAVHHGADGAVFHRCGTSFAAGAAAFPSEVQHTACNQGDHDHQRNDPPDHAPPFLFAYRAFFCLLRRFRRGRDGSFRRGQLLLFFHDLCHVIFSFCDSPGRTARLLSVSPC